MVTVQNLHGTSDRHPDDDKYWKDFWEHRKGSFTDCSRSGCNRAATVGAHVIKSGDAEKNWYIVPLCAGCNHLSGTFEVPENRLVPVNE